MLRGYSYREFVQKLYNYDFPSLRLKFSCCVFVSGYVSVALNIIEGTF